MLSTLCKLGSGAVLAAFASTAWAHNAILDAAAKEPGAEVTASGIVYRSIVEGKGTSPAPLDRVRVHYRGTFPDGKEFESSYARNEPSDFPLNRVIKCWITGIQRMKVGGKAKLTCPAASAYGEKGAGGGEIPPNATLIFEIELLAINPIR